MTLPNPPGWVPTREARKGAAGQAAFIVRGGVWLDGAFLRNRSGFRLLLYCAAASFSQLRDSVPSVCVLPTKFASVLNAFGSTEVA
jgi:hypothetical protein